MLTGKWITDNCVLAIKNDNVVGVGILGGGGIIEHIFVREDFRRQRIGDLIARMLIRRAFERGFKKTFVRTPEEAVPFFVFLCFCGTKTENGYVCMEREGDVSGRC